MFAWGLPPVKAALNRLTPSWEVPGLHHAIVRTAPVVPQPKPEEARFDFAWLSATGTGILLAAVASAVWLRVSPARFVRLWLRTVHAHAVAAGDDRGHAGDRLHHPVQRDGRRPWGWR